MQSRIHMGTWKSISIYRFNRVHAYQIFEMQDVFLFRCLLFNWFLFRSLFGVVSLLFSNLFKGKKTAICLTVFERTCTVVKLRFVELHKFWSFLWIWFFIIVLILDFWIKNSVHLNPWVASIWLVPPYRL